MSSTKTRYQTTKFPSYRHHRSSGQAVVSLAGRDHYLGRFNSAESHREYDRLIAEWLAGGRNHSATLRICELLRAYLEHAKSYYRNPDGSPGKEFVDMRQSAIPLAEQYSRLPVTRFGPLALKAVRQQWVERGLARRHINQKINRIRRIFRWGVENELVPADVLRALEAVAPLRMGRTDARETEPIEPADEADVLPVMQLVSRQVAAMVQLQLLTAARPGEIVLIRPMDVDRTEEVWIYRPARHKTAYRGHSREIYIGPEGQRVLAPWLLRDARSYCFSPREAEQERYALRRQQRQTPMTPNHKKRKPRSKPKHAKRDAYDRDSYRRAIEYGIRLVKRERAQQNQPPIKRWTPHQLRHTAATKLRKQHGLDAAQKILGHRSADVTQIYAEVDRQRAIEIMSQTG